MHFASLRSRALAATAAVVVIGGPGACQPPRDTLDVLLVGNSYVYFNDLPALVQGISESLDGPVLRVAEHTHGGETLRGHLDDGHVAELLTDGPADGAWEWVVFQEQSTLGAEYDGETGALGAPVAFHAAVRELVPMARDVGAQPALYMTWAKETFPAQASVIAEAYRDIADEVSVPVAPVGEAWAEAWTQVPGVDLFIDDGSHPNPRGSYLAACVIYATLTGRSPVGAAHEIQGAPWDFAGLVASSQPTVLVSLDAGDAAMIQRIAAQVVGVPDPPPSSPPDV